MTILLRDSEIPEFWATPPPTKKARWDALTGEQCFPGTGEAGCGAFHPSISRDIGTGTTGDLKGSPPHILIVLNVGGSQVMWS